MYFVADSTTMSAPYSIGRSNTGVALVLSIISGSPFSCAIFASVSTSTMSSFGFPSVSVNTARVFGVIALRSPSKSSASTNFTVMPSFGSV